MAKDKEIGDIAGDTTLKELHGTNLPSGVPVIPEHSNSEIEAIDPTELRPEALPLLIKSSSGSWKNAEQDAYAKILNAAAYTQGARWSLNQVDFKGEEIPNSSHKAVELARLAEIGTNPSAYYRYTGTQPGQSNLEFKTKLTSNE